MKVEVEYRMAVMAKGMCGRQTFRELSEAFRELSEAFREHSDAFKEH